MYRIVEISIRIGEGHLCLRETAHGKWGTRIRGRISGGGKGTRPPGLDLERSRDFQPRFLPLLLLLIPLLARVIRCLPAQSGGRWPISAPLRLNLPRHTTQSEFVPKQFSNFCNCLFNHAAYSLVFLVHFSIIFLPFFCLFLFGNPFDFNSIKKKIVRMIEMYSFNFWDSSNKEFRFLFFLVFLVYFSRRLSFLFLFGNPFDFNSIKKRKLFEWLRCILWIFEILLIKSLDFYSFKLNLFY